MPTADAQRWGDDGGGRPPRAIREGWLLAILFAGALGVRALAIAEFRAVPSFDHLLIDAVAYDTWAREIAAGSWWGDRVFYQAPAYPYLIALLYRLAGPDPLWIRVFQAAAGALSCLFVALATRELFGRRAGWIAGVALALYPPAIFFDGIVQKTSLGLLLMTALLWQLCAFQRRGGPLRLGAAGLLLGLLCLTRENALILLPVLPAWLWWRFRAEPPARRARWLALALAGALLALGPVAARNFAVGRTLAVTTSQLGTNFWYGNGPDANGLYVPLLPGRQTPVYESPDARRLAEAEEGRPLTAGEVSRYWLRRTLDHIAEEPARWLRLLGTKLLFTLGAYEIPDTEDVYVYADWSRVLRLLLPVWHFGNLLALAAAGSVIAATGTGGRARRRDAALLLWLGAPYAAGVVLFLVAARFRFPLVPLLLPLAALALAEARSTVARASRSAVAVAAAAALGCGALAALPLLDRDALRASSYLNFAVVALRDGELAAAEDHLLRAVELRAADADLQFHLGVLRARQQRLAEAERHLRRAIALEPRDHRSHRVLAQVLQRQGRGEAARRQRRLARALDPERSGSAGSDAKANERRSRAESGEQRAAPARRDSGEKSGER